MVRAVGVVKKEKLCQSFGTLTKFIGFLLHGLAADAAGFTRIMIEI